MQKRITKKTDTKNPYPLDVNLAARQITPATTPAAPKTTQEQKPYILPATGYVRLKQLLQIIPFSAATVWRKSKDGSFPAPVRLSEKITAWPVEKVREFMSSKEAA